MRHTRRADLVRLDSTTRGLCFTRRRVRVCPVRCGRVPRGDRVRARVAAVLSLISFTLTTEYVLLRRLDTY